MTTLVTGATGFTGGTLVRALCRQGSLRVRALVRPQTDASSLDSLGIEVVRGDLRDANAVRDAARGCETIYHIAAVFRTAGHPESFYRDVNVQGTSNVIAAAKRHRVSRLIHCSTVGVHGHIDAEHIPADESAPLAPGDIYQQTKLEAEQLVQTAIRDRLPATIFRPGGIYGPGDLRFLKLFRSILTGRFRMFGSGRTLYHLTYIDDLVNGIVLCGGRPEALGHTYILAGPRYTTLAELVEEIGRVLNVRPPRGRLPLWPLLAAAAICEAACVSFGIDPPLHRRRVDFFRKDRAFSIEKARHELGFEPRVDLREGLTNTAAWYFEKGHLERRAARFALPPSPGRALEHGKRTPPVRGRTA